LDLLIALGFVFLLMLYSALRLTVNTISIAIESRSAMLTDLIFSWLELRNAELSPMACPTAFSRAKLFFPVVLVIYTAISAN
jgi:hypothetical protein